MKARKTLTLLLLAALTFAACKYDDSELWEQVNQNTEELAAQAARIAALEAWQAETNTNIGRIPVACTQITLGYVSEGQLAKLIGSRTDLTTITVTSGTLNGADWAAIKRNEWALRTLDLAGATYYTSNLRYVKMLYADPVPLTTAKLPQGVTVLGIDAFVNCNNLTSIELPASLTEIRGNAFSGCGKLVSITCLSATPPSLKGTDIFYKCYALTEIRVPSGSENAYKQVPGWNNYNIVAIPEP